MSSEAGCRRRAGGRQQSPKFTKDASGRTQRRERKDMTLTQGDPPTERLGEVSRGRSSEWRRCESTAERRAEERKNKAKQ